MRIGDILIECGCATPEEVRAAIRVQSEDRSKRLGEILLDMGIVTEDQLLVALGERLKVSVVDFESVDVDLTVADMVPQSVCVKYQMLPIYKSQGNVIIAVNDPMDFYAIEDVKSFIQDQSEIVLCNKADLKKMIDKAFAELNTRKAADKAGADLIATTKLVGMDDIGSVDSNKEAPVVALVNSILVKAYSDGVSDIHFEPFETFLKVRFRVDGQLVEYMRLEAEMVSQLTTRIKIISDLDIAERRIPQDGNFKVKIGDDEVGIRVSVLPTVFGEKMVLRFLSQSVQLDNIESYGMNERNYEAISRILKNPHGIIYVTGPTGSGKTTTLYMILQAMGQGAINISTIEDPVERNLAGITQVQVNNKSGLTFEAGLRSMLRQDPDVILVGETRDGETASIAVSAAITGHLVLSTLHTNDAISSVVRLADMGIKHYQIANSVAGIVAQRLVKKICILCKEEHEITEMDEKMIPGLRKAYKGRGCSGCNNTGYKGRIAVHEVFEVDKEIRSLIAEGAKTEVINAHVREQDKMEFMSDNIAQLVIDGVTTMDEYNKYSALDV